jgi:anti-anti-sigma factor
VVDTTVGAVYSLDVAGDARLEKELMDAQPSVGAVTQVTFMTSGGLRVIPKTAQRLMSEQKAMPGVTAVNETGRDVFAMSGFDNLIAVE